MNPEQLKNFGVTGLIATVIVCAMNIGYFATKTDIAMLRADLATYYVTKTDIEKRLDKIETSIQLVLEQIQRNHHK